MFHSTWDLEVHARDMQERRRREADRARQIETARRRGGPGGLPAGGRSISWLVAMARTWLLPRQTMTIDSIAGAEAPGQVPAKLHPMSVEEPRFKPAARSNRLSQPYAGMVVLARGTVARTAEEPSAVGDC